MSRKVYHFTTLESAKAIVENKNLKLSRINNLNDPFEFLSENIGKKEFRQNIKKTKKIINEKYGIVSFSKSWRNPVQWAHYADRHKGICLEFNISDELLSDIIYHTNRLEQDFTSDKLALLKYKFNSWRYEQETRLIIKLNDSKIIKSNNSHFISFDEDLKLNGIIFGANTTQEAENEIYQVITPNYSIEYNKARPAFQSFRMTRKKDWKKQ